MVKAIEANEAELMLMGIRPFDFSTDFGYIKTENSGGDFFVRCVLLKSLI